MTKLAARKRVNPTESQTFVAAIAAAMKNPPTDLDLEYLEVCSRAATNVGNPIVASRPVGHEKVTKQSPDKVAPWGRVCSPRFVAGSSGAIAGVRNSAMSARNNVFEVIDRVSAFISKAKNAGFAPPANPFVSIAEHNANGTSATVAEAEELTANIKKYVQLLTAERNGQVDVEDQTEHAAQLSSVNISLDGFGGSGNTAVDLMSFIPNMDEIRAQKAKEALAALDFRKRVPKIMFTATYAPDGDSRGCIIGWKKIADASGYILKRRNIFDGNQDKIVITNQEAKENHSRFKNYVKSWVMSFYNDIPLDSVHFMLDTQAPENGFFLYTVQAYQNFQESKNTFVVDTVPANLSLTMRRTLRARIEVIDPGAGDTISPYPLLAQALLNDEKMDWALAAVNTRASIIRNDLRSYTRKFGYLGAQLDFLFSAMDEGKFVIPRDPKKVVSNVSQSITLFGVTQVILETLQETGALYHFDGVDARDQSVMKKDSPDIEGSGILSAVVSAIDPETMTLNLKSLTANLPKLAEETGTHPLVRDLGGDRAGVVDLTTFEGLGRLIRTVRVFADSRIAGASPNSSVRT